MVEPEVEEEVVEEHKAPTEGIVASADSPTNPGLQTARHTDPAATNVVVTTTGSSGRTAGERNRNPQEEPGTTEAPEEREEEKSNRSR